MYISGNTRDKTVDLKETKDLYGRLMVFARSNKGTEQKQAVGTYEFTVCQRRFSAACSDNSKLIHALDNMVTDNAH